MLQVTLQDSAELASVCKSFSDAAAEILRQRRRSKVLLGEAVALLEVDTLERTHSSMERVSFINGNPHVCAVNARVRDCCARSTSLGSSSWFQAQRCSA